MNKILSDTRYVVAFAALVIICATVLVALDKVLWPDAVKVLGGLLGGLAMAWQRGTVAGTSETPTPPILPLLMWTVVYFSGFMVLGSCASAKPYLRTADDAASWACAAFYGKKQGLSLDDAAKTFCKSKAQLQPWLDQLLALERQGLSADKCEVTVKDAGVD